MSVVLIALLSACGGGGGSSSSTPATPDAGSPAPPSPNYAVSAYRSASPYASVLPPCVLAETRSDACSLATLPLIGAGGDVTRESIMQRLAVSHDWMGARFEALLTRLPDEIIQLFGAVSGVVVSYDIRPSYYWRLTNAIYLDPADLWLTNDEKATILTDPDYRAGFGSSLKFLSIWDYMLGNQFAWDTYPLSGEEERTLDDIVLTNAQLILHELAHANDVFPPRFWNNLDVNKKPDLAAQDIISRWASYKLERQYPLSSSLMFEVGEVLFQGVDASQDILALTAADLGTAMDPDGANDDYNYATIREDVAMLFEEAMMAYLYGTDRIVAFLDRPQTDNPSCDDYLVGWGQRGRIAAPQMAPRVTLVIDHILPDLDPSAVIESFPQVLDFEPGQGYCQNIRTTSAERSLVSPMIPRDDRTITPAKLSPRFHKDRLRLE
ncbi:MAG TPA: hypothetical protein VLA24_11760 [Pseudomonadales bacterium]|nr:hypothetical protein [Pseudomonadales bacterium]